MISLSPLNTKATFSYIYFMLSKYSYRLMFYTYCKSGILFWNIYLILLKCRWAPNILKVGITWDLCLINLSRSLQRSVITFSQILLSARFTVIGILLTITKGVLLLTNLICGEHTRSDVYSN